LAAELSANRSLLAEIRSAIDGGLPAYAECGGLMYLARSISWHNVSYPMVGALPADVVMQTRPVGRGYVHLQETDASPWPQRFRGTIKAHEFHHSKLVNLDPRIAFAYRVLRGFGVDGDNDGLVYRNTLASYAHLRTVAGNDWPARFVAFARAAAGGEQRASAA
jgi:cobyrinic acid a,c-diamide synthase